MITIENCAIATVSGPEYTRGHVVADPATGRIVAVGSGPFTGAVSRRIDGTGCLLTPGLINTHHHLYQWATRGLAQDDTLFGWLTTLYPIWSRIDEDIVHASASAGLAWLALTGCTLSTDHHYLYPPGGDLFGATVSAAAAIGLRFHPTRGSMDLGASAGGLPPDSVVETVDAALAATADAIDRFHDPSPSAMVQVGVAPCSPFSVTGTLMREAAALARDRGVRLHTHLAETRDEEEFCLASFGCTPVDYAEKLGWLGDDVWLAHAVHLSTQDISKINSAGTGVAHCPGSNARLGAGLAPARELHLVGLGVDGPASQENGSMIAELRHALYTARLRGGPTAMTVRDALFMATLGGARCLGRDADLGTIEVGKLADLALWRLDGLPHAGIADPVAALVLGPPAPLESLLVGARDIVHAGTLLTADPLALARNATRAAHRLLGSR
ncbi:8-oxoguanine deaminase [Catenuloplanes japonicus]|uniref:8-oxoguanine deaminase n=1 Tax=Catenuloplanes japonicus TaxID=33876 RepID=UPI0005241F8C|nr:8-oxoguanine deaminase [Catenuloplanes japonicus]